MKLPNNVDELNRWLETYFTVYKTPERAYAEFPVYFTLGESGDQHAMYSHRIHYYTLALLGKQRDCCRAIAEEILKCGVTQEALQDKYEPVFLRSPFELHKDDGVYMVQGRLAFWRNKYNEQLGKSYCIKPQGALLAKVILNTEVE